LVDEPARRRTGFRNGTIIRMADGQMWTMPAPLTVLEQENPPFGTEYTDLIRAIEQAESRRERLLAELSFAIFLLGHNYCLSPADYEQLLGFSPDSPDLFEWQLAVRRVTEAHLQSLADASCLRVDRTPILPRQGCFWRLKAWIRDRISSRWRSLNSRIC
jgi:hypothetical protein